METNSEADDLKCPICLYIFIEPVTMPCGHCLCMPCFKQNVELSSLVCPLCRQRISNWARRASRQNKLIDRAKWKKIRSEYPGKVKARLEGKEESDVEDTPHSWNYYHLAAPGELRKEYETEMKKLEEARIKQQLLEEEASKKLLAQLADEENHLDNQLSQDEAVAKALNSNLNPALPTPPSKKSTILERFLEQGKRKPDPYPYSCISPGDKPSTSKADSVKNSPEGLNPILMKENTPESRSSSVIFLEENPAIQPGIKSKVEQPSRKSSKSSDISILISEMSKREPSPSSVTKINPPVRRITKRRLSEESHDSISEELVHFRPIQRVPRTPPKRKPDGTSIRDNIIYSKPINNTTPETTGSKTSSLHLKTAESLIEGEQNFVLRQRLENLAKERKAQVEAQSKATETEEHGSLLFTPPMKRRSFHDLRAGKLTIHLPSSTTTPSDFELDCALGFKNVEDFPDLPSLPNNLIAEVPSIAPHENQINSQTAISQLNPSPKAASKPQEVKSHEDEKVKRSPGKVYRMKKNVDCSKQIAVALFAEETDVKLTSSEISTGKSENGSGNLLTSEKCSVNDKCSSNQPSSHEDVKENIENDCEHSSYKETVVKKEKARLCKDSKAVIHADFNPAAVAVVKTKLTLSKCALEPPAKKSRTRTTEETSKTTRRSARSRNKSRRDNSKLKSKKQGNKQRTMTDIYSEQSKKSEEETIFCKKSESSKTPDEGLSEELEEKQLSDFATHEQYNAYIAERDHQLALKLQHDFNLEQKYQWNVIRTAEHDGDYQLRGRTSRSSKSSA